MRNMIMKGVLGFYNPTTHQLGEIPKEPKKK